MNGAPRDRNSMKMETIESSCLSNCDVVGMEIEFTKEELAYLEEIIFCHNRMEIIEGHMEKECSCGKYWNPHLPKNFKPSVRKRNKISKKIIKELGEPK